MPQQRIRVLTILSVSLILLCELAACQTQSQEIKIGVLANRTEKYLATSGQPTINAAQLAVQRINAAGGLDVGGRKVKIALVIEDDQNKPEAAVAAAQKMINQQSIVAIVGPQFSKNAIAVANVAESASVPMISPMSTNPQTTAGKQFAFRVGFVDDFQGQVMANFARNELGIQEAAVLYDVADDYSKSLAEIFRQVFEQSGGHIVAFEAYTTDNKNFGPQLERIKQSGAGALFLPNYTEDVPIQVKLARQLGIEATFLGGDTWNTLNAQETSELAGGFFSTHWQLDNDNQESKTFVEMYRQAYSQDPYITAAMTYDAFGLLFQAIQNQGKTDPESIQRGLVSIKAYKGVSGVIGYQNGGDPIKSAVIMQVKADRSTFYKLVNP